MVEKFTFALVCNNIFGYICVYVEASKIPYGHTCLFNFNKPAFDAAIPRKFANILITVNNRSETGETEASHDIYQCKELYIQCRIEECV